MEAESLQLLRLIINVSGSCFSSLSEYHISWTSWSNPGFWPHLTTIAKALRRGGLHPEHSDRERLQK